MKWKNDTANGVKEATMNGTSEQTANGVKSKQKRKNKCDLGPDFIAPDGGWGWVVVIASGLANMCQFPVLQQFGLLFKERLESIGLTPSEITTIINLNPCITSCAGLLNGPMFRRFTYRQVAIFGGLLVATGVFLTSISNSFTTYLITFSILYGAGSGINASANSLALNTYFKEKRRIATGLVWTITGMGPILFPKLIPPLLDLLGVQSTLWIFTGLALNTIVCGLLFHPVQRHVKKDQTNQEDALISHECDFCLMAKQRNQSVLSSQYLYNADNASTTGYEIIDPGVPMLSLANDGWSSKRSLYGSRSSLYSDRTSRFGSRKPSSQNLVSLNRSSSVNLAAMAKKRKISNSKIEEQPEDGSSGKNSQENVGDGTKPLIQPTPDIHVSIDGNVDIKYIINDNQTALSTTKTSFTPQRKISSTNNFNVEKEILKNVSEKLEEYVVTGKHTPNLDGHCTCDEKQRLRLDPKLVEELNKEKKKTSSFQFGRKL